LLLSDWESENHLNGTFSKISQSINFPITQS
jgi:hypothetical protein